MSRVKIVATIGPATIEPENLRALVGAGMDVARLNGSHADLGWHARTIAALRREAPHVPILFDLPGSKVRIGIMEDRPVRANDTIILTTAGEPDASRVPVTYGGLHEDVRAGAIVLINDARVRLRVIEVRGRDLICQAETEGVIQSGKGINVPGARLRGEAITERDRSLLAFACEQGIDFVGASFVRTAAHVDEMRSLIGGALPRIVAKIETDEALLNLGEIAEAADGLMIDRGDLSIETGVERLLIQQKRVVEEARRRAKPVIVATELLQSMTTDPLPLKAEISDISTAVFDGAAALMLSAETAVGRFPIEAVSLMRRVADAVTEHWHESKAPSATDAREIPHAVEDAAVLMTERLPITKIVAITKSGYAARLLAARRPRPPILAVSSDPAAARACNLLPGTRGLHVDVRFTRTSTDHIPLCLEALWRRGELTDTDLVLVASLAYPRSGNRLNLIQTHLVSDLVESLGWTREGSA